MNYLLKTFLLSSVLTTFFVACGGGSESSDETSNAQNMAEDNSTQIIPVSVSYASIDENVSEFSYEKYSSPIAPVPNTIGRALLAPNSNGTWDVVTAVYKKYREEQRVYSFDLGSKSSIFSAREYFDDSIEGWAGYTAALDANGKMYILTRSQPNWHIHTYDATTNSFEFRKYTMPSYMVGGISNIITGQNGKIYAAGGYNENGKNSVMMVEIDPATGNLKEYKDIGISNAGPTNAESIYVDQTHAYIVTGRIPYRITALNLSTLEEKELAVSDGLLSIAPGSYGAYSDAVAPGGLKGSWLFNGALYVYIKDAVSGVSTPPWSNGADGKEYVYLSTPEDLYFPNKPEVYNELIGEGVNKKLWFKLAGQSWDNMDVLMPQYTRGIKRLVKAENADFILMAGGEYSGVGKHELNTNLQTYSGASGISIYTMQSAGDKIYIGGYPNAAIQVYDTSKDFIGKVDYDAFHPDNANAVRDESERNPKNLANLYLQGGCKTLYASVLAADAKIYYTGKWRDNGNGGCLSWIDTTDDTTDGFSQIFSNYRGRDVTTTGNGRYVVISTEGVEDVNDASKPEPENGRLFVYDTLLDKTQEMRMWDPFSEAEAATTGYIVGSGGTTITGIVNVKNDAERKTAYVYKMDVLTGKLLFKTQIDKGVAFTAFDNHNSQEIIRYYKGHVYFIAGWTWRDKYFVRVEEDGSLRSMAKLPINDGFSEFIFVGNDLYGSSGEEVRKVANIIE